MSKFNSDDIKWMAEAIRLARLGEGLTRPNPPVGAVVVKGREKVGWGYHRKAGGPHAEIYALRQAGPKARGATLYVTLEPCSSWGRTPPCTDAICSSGIKRVVYATTDPNPKHAGKGLALLRKAGIIVEGGVKADEAAEILRPFTSSMRRARPYVTVKLAASLDGRIADFAGCSKWISGPKARAYVQALRRRSDAIMVGSATAVHDNPSLWPRPARGRSPFRVIVDAAGSIPPQSQVLTDEFSKNTLLATTRRCPEARQKACIRAGAQVMVLPAAGREVSLLALMKALHDKGIMQVVCEGGGVLFGALLKADLVDELVLIVAPLILGANGCPVVGGIDWALAKAPRMQIVEVSRMGRDLMIRMTRKVQRT